jgi:hypothetical protein
VLSVWHMQRDVSLELMTRKIRWVMERI